MTGPAAATEIDRALCRSALWEALALGLRPPAAETVARLASTDGAAALAAAARVLDDEEALGLTPAVLALGTVPAETLEDLARAYSRLFGHTARGAVPPYETEYGDDSPWAPAREMSDLGAFYRAFGLRLRPDAHERPDHLACQCEFMLVLARKEAHALECGEGEMGEATRQAARRFLRDHLGRWVPAFGSKLDRTATGFYRALGVLSRAFVTAECRRAGVAAGPEFLRLRSTESAEMPMACGSSREACGS